MKKMCFILSLALVFMMSASATQRTPTPSVSSINYVVENSQVILITIYLSAPSDDDYQVYVPVYWNDYWTGQQHYDLAGGVWVHAGQTSVQLELQASDIGISYGITLDDPWFIN